MEIERYADGVYMQELDLSVQLREAADKRIGELEAAIQTYCEGKCPYKNFFTEEPLCEDGSGADWCPLYPYRGGE